jgi:hypothetical protein
VRIIVIAIIVAFGIGVRANSIAIPLVDPADPVRITSANIDFSDATRAVMVIELENTTTESISTRDIWLSAGGFLTKSDAERAADRKIMDCVLMAPVAYEERTASVLPARGTLTARWPLTQCIAARDHQHYFVTVHRLGHRFSQPFWQRDVQDQGRLLAEVRERIDRE